MSVRFSRMWACIGLWMVLDIIWGVADASLPTWAQIDARAAFGRDASTAFFIAFMWFFYGEPRAPHPPPVEGGENGFHRISQPSETIIGQDTPEDDAP